MDERRKVRQKGENNEEDHHRSNRSQRNADSGGVFKADPFRKGI